MISREDALKMKWSNLEMRNMMHVYSECRCNSRAAERLFRERYPATEIFPREDEFRRLDQRLQTTSSFYPSNREGILEF